MRIESIPEFVVGESNIRGKKERIDLGSIIDKSLSDLRKLEGKKEILKVKIKYVSIIYQNFQDIANKKDQLTITGIEIAYQLLDKFCFVKPVETDYLRIEYKKILRNNISRKGHWEIHKYENRIHRCQG